MAKEKLLITLAVLIKAVIAVTVEVAVAVETKVEIEVAVVLKIVVDGFPSSPSTHSPSGFAFLVASLANSMLGPTPVL